MSMNAGFLTFALLLCACSSRGSDRDAHVVRTRDGSAPDGAVPGGDGSVLPPTDAAHAICTPGSGGSGAAPTYDWARGFPYTGRVDGEGLTVDSESNLYLAATVRGAVDLGEGAIPGGIAEDILLASWDPCGSLRWHRRFDGNVDFAAGLAIDSRDHLYLVGQSTESIDFGEGIVSASEPGVGSFVVSFDKDGRPLWSQSIRGSNHQQARAVAVDTSDNVYIAGNFNFEAVIGTTTHTGDDTIDTFVGSFRGDTGAYRWSRALSSSADLNAEALSAGGDLVALTGSLRGGADFGTGLLSPASEKGDVYVTLLERSTGATSQAWLLGGMGDETAGGIGIDDSENVYVLGLFEDTVDFGVGAIAAVGREDLFLASYDRAGAHRWSRTLGSVEDEQGVALELTLDAESNIVATGGFQGTVSFGGAPLTSFGWLDGFIASYDSSGGHKWSRSWGGSDLDEVQGLAVGRGGELYVSGQFTNSVDFGDEIVTTNVWSNFFIMRLRR